jgi:anti-sigma factor RsiW
LVRELWVFPSYSIAKTMSLSPRIPIDDELLSAYIDGELTDAEKATVESAIAQDPHVAWQVESLQQTVRLLSGLPLVPLPRSFTLDETAFAEGLEADEGQERDSDQLTSAASTSQIRSPRAGGFWHSLTTFFKSGSLLLRNAAAVAALLFLVLWVGDPHQGVLPLTRGSQQAGASLAASPAAESATAIAEMGVSAAAGSDVANDTVEEPPAEPVEAPAMAEEAGESEVSTTDAAPGFEAEQAGSTADRGGEVAQEAEPGTEAASLSIPAEGDVEAAPTSPEGSQARAMPRPSIMAVTEPPLQTREDMPAPASGPAQAESAEVQAMAVPDTAEMTATEAPANAELAPEMDPVPGIAEPPAVADGSAVQGKVETLPMREQPVLAPEEGEVSESASGSRSQPGMAYPLSLSGIWLAGRIAAILLFLVFLLLWWNSRRAVGR